LVTPGAKRLGKPVRRLTKNVMGDVARVAPKKKGWEKGGNFNHEIWGQGGFKTHCGLTTEEMKAQEKKRGGGQGRYRHGKRETDKRGRKKNGLKKKEK